MVDPNPIAIKIMMKAIWGGPLVFENWTMNDSLRNTDVRTRKGGGREGRVDASRGSSNGTHVGGVLEVEALT